MPSFRYFKDNILIRFVGFRETLFAVAELIYEKMEIYRCILEKRQLEKDLNYQFARLGEFVYSRGGSPQALDMDPRMMELSNLTKRLETMEHHLSELKNSQLQTTTMDLYRELVRGGKQLEWLDLLVNHPWCDQRVKDIGLPLGVLCILISRHGTVLIPNGETILKAGDRLTFLGSPIALQEMLNPPAELNPDIRTSLRLEESSEREREQFS